MRHLVKISIVVFLFLFAFSANGQTQEATIFDEATIVYSRSLYGGVILHTRGFGAQITAGKAKTAFKSQIFQLDLVGMKHPKEIRTFNPIRDQPRSYVFGKVNTFFVVRPTIGSRVVSFDKIRKSGVSVGYTWRVGPSLGITRPVYLEIEVKGESNHYDYVNVEKYDPQVHRYDEILGRAGGLRGMNELKLHPGVHGAFGLNFEYDANRSGMKGLEVGATVDYYPFEVIEIMAFAKNYNIFLNFYINFQFGKRYNP